MKLIIKNKEDVVIFKGDVNFRDFNNVSILIFKDEPYMYDSYARSANTMEYVHVNNPKIVDNILNGVTNEA